MDWKYYIDLLAQDQLQIIALPIFFLAIIVEWGIDEWRHLDLYKRVDSWVSIIYVGVHRNS